MFLFVTESEPTDYTTDMVISMESKDQQIENFKMDDSCEIHSIQNPNYTEEKSTLHEEEQFFDAHSSSHKDVTEFNGNSQKHSVSLDMVISDTSRTREEMDCHLKNNRKRKLSNEIGLKPNQLKELLVMQLDLIGHQQLKILEKDKEIISLKSEKEQLEARLSRMERRISIQKRQSIELTSQDDFTLTRSKVASPGIKSPLVTSYAQKRAVEVDKINMVPVTITSCNDKNFSFENFLRTNLPYLDIPLKSRNKRQNKKVLGKEKKVPVPPWRLVKQIDTESKDDLDEPYEDISNAAYERRHSKPEQEEKRRKRWDLQQARQQRQHEMLVQRYNGRQKGKLPSCSSTSDLIVTKTKQEPIERLARNSFNDLHAVDVTEIVPVCAFGYPLPALAPRELNIPWFSIAKREVQLRTAKQKQVTRARKRVKTSIVTHRRQRPKYAKT